MVSQNTASGTLTAHWKPTKPTKLGSNTSDSIPQNATEKLRLYRTAHNQVESRVYSLEQVARPYQEFERKTRKGIALMQDVRADILGKRQRALDDIDEKVEAAGVEYAGYVKRVAKGGVELSTNALAKALIKRLEDGDEVRGEIGEKLAGLLVGEQSSALVESSREACEEARALPTPSDDEAIVYEEMDGSSEPPPKRRRREQDTTVTSGRVNEQHSQVPEFAQDTSVQTPVTPGREDMQHSRKSPERRSTRSQKIPDIEQEEQAPEPTSSHSTNPETEDSSAIRRSSRRHLPTKRQQDFVTWGEVRASQEGKRRRS